MTATPTRPRRWMWRSPPPAGPLILDQRDFLPDPVPVQDFSPGDHEFSFDELPPCPRPWRHPVRCGVWIAQLLFGIASLVLLLAIIAAIPLINLLALGYLLEAEGRVARTGKLRYALPLLPIAPRLGGLALGIFLWQIPLYLLADFTADALLIDPDSAVAQRWVTATRVASVLITIHLVLAAARGGALSMFFRPVKNLLWLRKHGRQKSYWITAERAIREFVATLRLRYHFWLGTLGFLGALAWLLVPTILFASLNDTSKPGQRLAMLIGGALMILPLTWLPFLQAHFAASRNWKNLFDLRTIREYYRRSPMLWCLTVVATYAVSLPLHLFKAVVPPQDLMWFLTLIFISMIYPVRILTGWAWARAARRDHRSRWWWRWPWFIALIPAVMFYIFLLFFTPAISAHGRGVLLEHPALTLPVPF